MKSHELFFSSADIYTYIQDAFDAPHTVPHGDTLDDVMAPSTQSCEVSWLPLPQQLLHHTDLYFMYSSSTSNYYLYK